MNAKNKDRTPDILGSIMGSTREHESKKPINQASSKEAPVMESSTYCKQESCKAIEQEKEKVTFNLSVTTLEKLEDSWIELRRRFKGSQRITKTLIVEKALEIVLHDLEAHNESSELLRSLK